LPPREWEDDATIILSILSPIWKWREVLRTSSKKGQKMAKGAMKTGLWLKNKYCQSQRLFWAKTAAGIFWFSGGHPGGGAKW
jgi:hypothetical protein